MGRSGRWAHPGAVPPDGPVRIERTFRCRADIRSPRARPAECRTPGRAAACLARRRCRHSRTPPPVRSSGRHRLRPRTAMRGTSRGVPSGRHACADLRVAGLSCRFQGHQMMAASTSYGNRPSAALAARPFAHTIGRSAKPSTGSRRGTPARSPASSSPRAEKLICRCLHHGACRQCHSEIMDLRAELKVNSAVDADRATTAGGVGLNRYYTSCRFRPGSRRSICSARPRLACRRWR